MFISIPWGFVMEIQNLWINHKIDKKLSPRRDWQFDKKSQAAVAHPVAVGGQATFFGCSQWVPLPSSAP